MVASRPRKPARKAPPAAQDLEHSPALLVWALADAFERRLAAELAPMGLTVAGFRLVGELLRAPEGLRVGTLAARLRVKAPSVSAMVDRFEAQGLVERFADPDDARAARVRLSTTAPLSEGMEVLARLDGALVGDLGAPERASLLKHLTAATARLT